MQDFYISTFFILLNFIFLTFLVLFVSQRELYLYAEYPYLSIIEEHKTIKLEAEDSNPIDLRFIDNGADTDMFVMFGFITQETLYNGFDEMLKDMGKRFNIFTYFFRGLLGNQGIPSENSINKDIKAIGEYLKQRGRKTIGFGFTIGSCTILRLSNLTKFDQIILVDPFSSFRYLVKSIYGYFPVSLLLVDTWDNVHHIKKLKNTKIQIYATENDKVILLENSKILKQNNENVTLKRLPERINYNVFEMSIFKKIIYESINDTEDIYE